jgi:hypothetical protein
MPSGRLQAKKYIRYETLPLEREHLMNNTTPFCVSSSRMIIRWYREGLMALISRSPDMTIVAEANNGREAVEQFLLHSPDLALLADIAFSLLIELKIYRSGDVSNASMC